MSSPRPLLILRRIFAVVCGVVSSHVVFAATPVETARAHFEAGRFAEAGEILDKLAVAEPTNADVHYYLGVLALRQNKLEAAIANLEQATTLAPRNSRYWLELGGAYGTAAQKAGLLSKVGLAKKCRMAFEKAVQLDPDSLHARNALLTYYRLAPSILGGGMDKAYAQAEEIRQRDPIMGQTALAQLYASEKKYDQAINAFAAVAKDRPEDHHAHYEIGRVVADSGQQLDRGESALRRCLELTPRPNRPGHANVHWRLGLIAEKRGDRPSARACYEQALSLQPTFKEAKESLAKLN
jgi:tetratricopeptide (TPR) repeat protein